MRSLGCPRRSSPSWWRRQGVRLWRGSDARRSSTMDGVGPATESRDCVPVRGRRPAGRLGAARVAACELGRLAPLRHADRLNWYMPAAVQPAAAVPATAGEVIFAIALITGFRLREAASGSGVLLTIFGISMALTLGMKAPLDQRHPLAELHNTGRRTMKAIVMTDQAAGTAGMKLVERPEPQGASLASLSGANYGDVV